MNNNLLEKLCLFNRSRRAYRAVYATAEGKEVLEDIIALCKPWRCAKPTDARGRIDPYALAANHGALEIASHIVARLGMSDLEMQMKMKNAHAQGVTEHDE